MTDVVAALPLPRTSRAWLNYVTIGYNVLEAIVSIVAGIVAGSVALVGFGIDSVVEVTASGARNRCCGPILIPCGTNAWSASLGV